LCLHFANTVDWTDEGEPIPDTDALTEADSLERWGRRLGLPAAAAPPGSAAPPALAAGRDFRAAVYALLSTVADGDPAPPAALAVLHDIYAEAVVKGRLVPRDGAFVLEWAAGSRSVLYAVAADAAALLADPALLARLHRCPGRNCGWLFLDTSGRRRWCSMDTCGSRAKMRRMYARRRQLEDPQLEREV
jgi:predicted RNA-binding Zn ribbon-like protein